MSNLKANMIEALESEREGLEARLRALGDTEGPPGQRAMLERRIGEVDEQLGVKPSAAKERRPARKPAEKRPE
jgi:hypothetical protein